MLKKDLIKNETVRKIKKDKTDTEFATNIDLSKDNSLLKNSNLFKEKENKPNK